MPVIPPLTTLLARARLPRRTVRLRLTLLYGGLSFISGFALLAVTYLLVRAALAPSDGDFRARYTRSGATLPDSPGPGVGPGGAPAEIQLSNILHLLLVSSLVALALMSVVSLIVGWIVAGRTLGPLRTITGTVRGISATNLHNRLAMTGTDDELKELGDTFDSLLDRLEGSFRAQRRFIANASHELRTPLARQRALGQVALSDPNATAQSLREAHERILVAGEQQERLIAALLTLARGQAGLETREPFDFGHVVDKVVRARGGDAGYRGLNLRHSIDTAMMAGHRGLTEQLVVNLVENAMRYNVPGGWLEVTACAVDSRATLTVVNTGPVVPREAIDDLYQPFHRRAASRGAHGDGLGLGLSIVRAIADAHDAVLRTEARPDGGLAIEVIFPSVAGKAQPPRSPVAGRPVAVRPR